MNNKKIAVIIAAAGSGSRMRRAKLPKQFIKIAGRSLLEISIEKFKAYHLMIIANAEYLDLYPKQYPICVGGETRSESVLSGLKALEGYNPDYVIIHDANRIFCSDQLIVGLVDKVRECDGVYPGISMRDTVRNNQNETLDRDNLHLVQTPQIFNYRKLLDCYKKNFCKLYTDEAAAMIASDFKVEMVAGEQKNFKITTEEDLAMAEKMMDFETRVGMGVDVHKYVHNNSRNVIKLGNVAIESDCAIEAHSDGDVLIHALVDAILGAISKGDIGQHFPPSDPQWKGGDSVFFLEHAVKLLQEAGGYIVNIDVTIMCEHPKISPHSLRIRESLAKILNLDICRVSIKATTTEKLGFLGRKEGIAAQAVATVKVRAT